MLTGNGNIHIRVGKMFLDVSFDFPAHGFVHVHLPFSLLNLLADGLCQFSKPLLQILHMHSLHSQSIRKIQIVRSIGIAAQIRSPQKSSHHIVNQITVYIRRRLPGQIPIKNLGNQFSCRLCISCLNGIKDFLFCLKRIIILALSVFHIIVYHQIRIQKSAVRLQFTRLQI